MPDTYFKTYYFLTWSSCDDEDAISSAMEAFDLGMGGLCSTYEEACAERDKLIKFYNDYDDKLEISQLIISVKRDVKV